MKRTIQRVGTVIVLVACGLTPMARAAEQSRTSTTPASSTASITQSLSVERGTIAALDLLSASPSLKVTRTDGTSMTFALDPKLVTVTKEGEGVGSKPEALRVGDRVTIRYTEKDGKKWVKSVSVKAASTTAASPVSPAGPSASSTTSASSSPASGMKKSY